ncbi:hypothetical protein JTB14_003961 [Gonioctena quinquepunctata]|nr:hypothetical protein JTB14_003961 [Gonioctena quinquepunctata]
MNHTCKLEVETESDEFFDSGTSCSRKIGKLLLISRNNPLNALYFRSETAVRDEKRRQLNLKHPYVIHPLSKFKAWYDAYLIFFYLEILIFKPLEVGFADGGKDMYPGFIYITIIVDILCWVDLLVNFSTGYVIKKTLRIELRYSYIIRNYIRSPLFYCDLLSSIPRYLPFAFWENPSKPLLAVLNICTLLRCVRIFTFLHVINRTAQYHQIIKRGWRFLFNSTVVTFILIHWLACMQFIVPKMSEIFTSQSSESWIYTHEIHEKHWTKRYFHCNFKASSEILGIRLDMYEMETASDYVVSILTYIVGKVLVFSIWIILVVAILNSRSMKLKFHEVINQVDEYMKKKQVPISLRDRIKNYYDFRYQGKLLSEDVITNLLSANLKREVHINMCKSLIEKVQIFNEMPPDQISGMVSKLIPETFLPKDTILRSGSYSESLYFIASGTVAVYSHSGKEICHLQDGAYFGEISLVTKNHLLIATIVALETSHLYRLKKSDFEKCIKKNKNVFQKVIAAAEWKLKGLMRAEEMYKKMLFEKAHKTDVDAVSISP